MNSNPSNLPEDRDGSGGGPASRLRAIPTIASAMWTHREALKQKRSSIVELLDAVGHPEQFNLVQAMALLAFSLEFQPDLILELGRGHGNSTAVSTEAANLLGLNKCRVTSLCLTSFWQLETAGRIGRLRGEDWFAPLTAVRADIRSYDYERLFSDRSRVLVFWDAHGYGVAECVLGGILPLLARKTTYVLMHDMSDARYLHPAQLAYDGQRLWRGNNWTGRYVQLGNLFSNVEQSVAIVDFSSRNHLELTSLTHSLRTELSPDEREQLDQLVGLPLQTSDVGMYGLELSEPDVSRTFPRFDRPIWIERLWSRAVIGSFAVARRIRLEGLARRLLRLARRLRASE